MLGRPHDPYRFARQNPLARSRIDARQARKQGMIAFAVFDDQDLPVAAEGPGINDLPIVGRHDLSTWPGSDRYPLAGGSKFLVGPEFLDDLAPRGQRKAALRAADRAYRRGLAWAEGCEIFGVRAGAGRGLGRR